MNSDIFKGLLKKEKGKYFTEMVDRLQSLKYLYLVLNSLLTPGIVKVPRRPGRLASSLAGLAAEVSGWAGGQGRADARPARGPRRGARPGLAWPGFGEGGGAARAPRGAGVRPVRVSERGARTCGAGWWRGGVCTPRAAVGCVRYSALLRDRVPAARAEFLSGSPRCSWTEAGAGRCGRRGRE